MRLIFFIAAITWLTDAVATPLNHFQVIGSHNSYKKALNLGVKKELSKLNPKLTAQIDYGHINIIDQLNSGIRHLEIDVLKDPNGGLYLKPWAEHVSIEALYSQQEIEQLSTPGFKVMHIPGVDVQSHCILLSDCLNNLKKWSQENPYHFPIVIMINVKESGTSIDPQPLTLKFTVSDYQSLDAAIKQTLSDSLFTPDNLRKSALSLNETVIQLGWPNVNQLRQKFIFLFDGNKSQTSLYKKNRPSLRGASMFAHYEADQPEAAFMIVNNPIKHFKKIQKLIATGYMVRTRADAALDARKSEKIKQFNAAKNSGAQIISTDFIPGSPQQARFNYVVQFDHGHVVRKTPFNLNHF
ncbi:Ca2+-dependent phosphoinositide-specific phospholipase C [Pseudoalteromonas marina]|jgi:hypothetical protein|uniref:Ca2+-dependent phosphoinositide-specific phospholipase C n=1 Tax=Pseudoalteromonas marina TaxID=267375 RepID=UPI0023F093D0|nr:Ca2+-dependent phosphoinositide-specific phospholipase C [Pseudoalteromonas marina]